MKNRLAPAAAIAAALLAGSTGYCAITYGDPPLPLAPPAYTPPTRLYPEVIEPFPLDEPGDLANDPAN